MLRFFTRLKCRLMPYLFGAAVEAHETGVPVLRAMSMEFPDDPGCDRLDLQYMLGDSLLVAPVCTHDGSVDVYVPEGCWTNVLTGEQLEGGRWIRETYDFMTLPLLARPNCMIPLGAIEDRPDYDYADGVIFHVFALEDEGETSITIPTQNGEVAMHLTVSRKGSEITVKPRGALKPWSICLRGIDDVVSVEGGNAEPSAQGVRLVPDSAIRTLIVSL